jgi:hypothetical protein
MKFDCTNCGRKLRVPDATAGKKGRCPQCKVVLTVPAPAAEAAKSPHDLELLDVPPSAGDEAVPPRAVDESATAYEQLQGALGGRLMAPEEAPERKYPWIIDIFLYPLNFSALTMVLICVGGPFLLRIVVKFFIAFTIHIPVLIIGWAIALVLHWLALLVLTAYMIWYLFACVRDSADGGIRAPNTLAITPGLGELFMEFFRLLVCIGLLWVPTQVYLVLGAPVDTLYLVLVGLGSFAFPMALLGVIMYESVAGLNPLMIVCAIGRTFFHYLLLVPFCYALWLIVPLAYRLILDPRYWHWAYVLQALDFCLLMILAHLLGRFFWKHQEKLNWDA